MIVLREFHPYVRICAIVPSSLVLFFGWKISIRDNLHHNRRTIVYTYTRATDWAVALFRYTRRPIDVILLSDAFVVGGGRELLDHFFPSPSAAHARTPAVIFIA